jgi:tetratricopeptide (TPR) repeat protein
VLNRPAEAEAEIRRAVSGLERVPASPRAMRSEANLRLILGDLVAGRNPEEASRQFEQAAARWLEADRLDPNGPDPAPIASVAAIKQGNLWLERDPARALAEYRKGIAAFAALDPASRQSAIRIETNLLRKEGNALAALRQFEPALRSLRASLAISERILALNPTDKRAQYDLAVNLNDLALALESAGQRTECIQVTERTLALLGPLARAAGPKSAYAAALAEVEERSARLRR